MPRLLVPSIADLTAVYACYRLLPVLWCQNVSIHALAFWPLIRSIFEYPQRKIEACSNPYAQTHVCVVYMLGDQTGTAPFTAEELHNSSCIKLVQFQLTHALDDSGEP